MLIWLNEHTKRIQNLVDEGTEESLTFAALQCRLAIEAVCYERLRNAHDYISADDLRRWQPSYVINQLIQEVDPYAAASYSISVSKHPAPEGASLTQSEYEAVEYVEVGRQIGFDSKKLGKLWNALGSFLHVKMPQNRDDHIRFFSEGSDIAKKVTEALVVLHELECGTLISSGIGERVSFECGCGQKNARRAGLLQQGQIVSCANPDCLERWTVSINGADIGFERREVTVTCSACKAPHVFPEKLPNSLERGQMMRFLCRECEVENFVVWKLMQVHPGHVPTKASN